jgi:ABC-2 type transport system ATP-binding protein
MIEVSNLGKYYGGVAAVDDISFKVEQGDILGFLGPNGAGKTTTMRILTCFMAPSRGTAKINDQDILQDSLAVRHNIGYLPENVPLYNDMSVRGYLLHMAALRGVPRKKRPERLEAALDAGKLEDRAETLIGKLSKGYRQRVGIAQAVIHDPPVLILDEPSAGLDPRQRVETRQFIKSLSKNHTIILSTHILPDVQDICSRVVIINKGRIVAQDTLANLETNQSANPRVQVRLKNPSSDVPNRLQQIDGVTKARREKDNDGESTFVLECAPGKDVREAAAKLCVEQNWGLLELQRQGTSLEDIFLRSTTMEENYGGETVPATESL